MLYIERARPAPRSRCCCAYRKKKRAYVSIYIYVCYRERELGRRHGAGAVVHTGEKKRDKKTIAYVSLYINMYAYAMYTYCMHLCMYADVC